MTDVAEPVLQKRRELQQVMTLLGALSSGLEQVVGRGAAGMSFAAGRTLGKQFSE